MSTTVSKPRNTRKDKGKIRKVSRIPQEEIDSILKVYYYDVEPGRCVACGHTFGSRAKITEHSGYQWLKMHSKCLLEMYNDAITESKNAKR